MKIYGITIVDTECCFVYEGHYRESSTVLGLNKKELAEKAYESYKGLFMGCEFEDGKDYNDEPIMSKKAFIAELKSGGCPCIQASDHHYEFDMFEQDVEVAA